MWQRLSAQHRITLVVILAAVAVLVAIVVYEIVRQPEQPAGAASTSALVRDDSHVLDAAKDDAVTLVEFLDFECESCRAAHPFVEDLRETYDGQARQGRFEAMYTQMYETQTQWGERQDSQAALFRGFAEDMGLDMAQFDADVDSPDVDDGLALGVSGTPTFFLNGEILQVGTTEEFTDAIDAVLERASRAS